MERVIADSFQASGSLDCVRKGERVAIAVGSRGIHQIDRIVRAVVLEVTKRGGQAQIIPAMGSHGGATAEGQEAVLKSFCLLYTSPSPRDLSTSRMPSSA